MTDSTRRLSIVGCGLTLLVCIGCGRAPEGWTPVLEESSTAFLQTETEAVAAHVRLAQAQLPVDPESAAAELAAADDGLDHLLTYYLPLLEARERSYNAYRYHYLDQPEQTARELEEIERLLLEVAEVGHGHLLREMEEPLDKLENARAALEVDHDEASKSLGELASRLNFLLLKGDLVLSG